MKPDIVLRPQAPAGLVVQDLVVHRGGSQIVSGVELAAPPGEVTVLLGPNGAGKTTLLEALSGRIPASRGTVRIGGRDVLRCTRVARAHLGLAHVEQGRTVFRDLTVEENLRVAARTGGLDDAFTLFPELWPRSKVAAGALSGGEQQLLVLARAMLRRPQVLLIDEMSLGLAPVVVQRLLPAVSTLAAQGVAVLLVEQYAAMALSIGTTAMVLFRGQIVLRGRAVELGHETERLHRAYLGGVDPPTSGGPTADHPKHQKKELA